MFLDATYFVSDLSLAQYSFNTAGTLAERLGRVDITEGETPLDMFIDKYEIEFLELLLGKILAQKFIEGLQAETPLPIWLELKKQIYKEIGINGRTKISPAANYVYCAVLDNSISQSSMTGEVKFEGENSKSLYPDGKKMLAWNSMVDMIKDVEIWLIYHRKEIADAICPNNREHINDVRWFPMHRHRFGHIGYINPLGI